MTIASCYVTPEGVVLGADSTASAMVSGGFHYFNHNQKVFEIGEDSTLGVVTWGMGGFPEMSHRRLFALLADDIRVRPPASVEDVANRLVELIWLAYAQSPTFSPLVAQGRALAARPVRGSGAPNERTDADEEQLTNLRQGLPVGFCVAGYIMSDRIPRAWQVTVDPLDGKPTPAELGGWTFWGAPNMISRLVNGRDQALRDALLASGLWNGTENDLDTLLGQYVLGTEVIVPIREAVDFVYSSIATTIKALKFSPFSQICGGPIEVAVITCDRKFRWVRHKPWDTAILEGDHDGPPEP